MLWLALKHTLEPAPADARAQGQHHTQWLGTWALQFSPRVAWAEEAWLLEISTTLRLWGGLDGVLRQLHARFARLGVGGALQVHTGPSALAALARQRASAASATEINGMPLAHLPLHTLSSARPHAPALARLGVHTWGQLCRLPRQGVARRWGHALLLALDQGLGNAPEALPWLAPAQVFDQTLTFTHTLDTTTALMHPAQQLLAALHGWLLQGHRGALALRWQWAHDPRRDVPREGTLDLRTAQPTQHLAHLQRLTAEHLAHTQLPAPVTSLRLLTLAHAACVPTSTDWLALPTGPGTEATTTHHWAELLERLSARLGPQAVVQWQAVPGHWPQGMQHPLPAQQARWPSHPVKGAPPPPGQVPPPLAAHLPTWLLQQPQALAMAGQRPCYLGALELLAGPQRLELTHWPTPGCATTHPPPEATAPAAPLWASHRDYFVARSPGAGLVWVFRVRDHAAPEHLWFLHGWFA